MVGRVDVNTGLDLPRLDFERCQKVSFSIKINTELTEIRTI